MSSRNSGRLQKGNKDEKGRNRLHEETTRQKSDFLKEKSISDGTRGRPGAEKKRNP